MTESSGSAGSGAAGAPLFVVVGNVNQGKSSIVATLAEDPTVPIDRFPGTTIEAGRYEFRAGGRTLFTLMDTPGFQEPRQALAWMQERSSSAEDRHDTVAAFVAAHEHGDRYADEVRLLRPILDGAGIIYVVDASSRFQPANEAEMEILRWTGCPGLALINRTHERDFAYDWNPVLNQFFGAVIAFDAHQATFEDRLELLRAFRAIRQDWRAPMDQALDAMGRDWSERRQQAARLIARQVTTTLTHVERVRLTDGSDEERISQSLEQRYREHLRKVEVEARQEIEGLYRHRQLEIELDPLDPNRADLFSETAWRAFGLTRMQLAKSGAIWGAAAGSVIDLAVGGLSFFAGAAIGGLSGGLAGWLGGSSVGRAWSEQSAVARQLLPGEHGRFRAMGPVNAPAFAWILLDRAALHVLAVSERAHARSDRLEVGAKDGPQGIVTRLDPALRKRLDQCFRRAIKRALDKGPTSTPDEKLVAAIDEVLVVAVQTRSDAADT